MIVNVKLKKEMYSFAYISIFLADNDWNISDQIYFTYLPDNFDYQVRFLSAKYAQLPAYLK